MRSNVRIAAECGWRIWTHRRLRRFLRALTSSAFRYRSVGVCHQPWYLDGTFPEPPVFRGFPAKASRSRRVCLFSPCRVLRLSCDGLATFAEIELRAPPAQQRRGNLEALDVANACVF